MRSSSRCLVIAVAGSMLVLLAGLIYAEGARRQNLIRSERLAVQYAQVVQQLRGNIDTVQAKMKGNESLIPDSIDEAVPQPVPVKEAAPEPAPVPVAIQPAVEKIRAMSVQGISWNADKPLVMIDGRVYKVGDTISGLIICAIAPKSIIVSSIDGIRHEIILKREEQP